MRAQRGAKKRRACARQTQDGVANEHARSAIFAIISFLPYFSFARAAFDFCFGCCLAAHCRACGAAIPRSGADAERYVYVAKAQQETAPVVCRADAARARFRQQITFCPSAVSSDARPSEVRVDVADYSPQHMTSCILYAARSAVASTQSATLEI